MADVHLPGALRGQACKVSRGLRSRVWHNPQRGALGLARMGLDEICDPSSVQLGRVLLMHQEPRLKLLRACRVVELAHRDLDQLRFAG